MATVYTIENANTTDPTTLDYDETLRYWYVPPTATGAWAGHARQLAYTLTPDDAQDWEFANLTPGDQGWNNDTERMYIETVGGLKRILTVDDLPLLMESPPMFSDAMDQAADRAA